MLKVLCWHFIRIKCGNSKKTIEARQKQLKHPCQGRYLAAKEMLKCLLMSRFVRLLPSHKQSDTLAWYVFLYQENPCQYFVVYRCEDSEDSPAVLPPVVVHRLELPLPGGVPGGEAGQAGQSPAGRDVPQWPGPLSLCSLSPYKSGGTWTCGPLSIILCQEISNIILTSNLPSKHSLDKGGSPHSKDKQSFIVSLSAFYLTSVI